MPAEGTMYKEALPQASSKYKLDIRVFCLGIKVYFGLRKR